MTQVDAPQAQPIIVKHAANACYEHRHAAHCETGVVSSLLRHYGLDISEPMTFGLSAAMFFTHLPFVKVEGFPLTAYRQTPGTVIKSIQKSLGVKFNLQRFRHPETGTATLNQHITDKRIVGLQASVFWLPYFPPDMRFHFNAHNLIVYGKEADDYMISDPVAEFTVTCPEKDLQKARFVKGIFAPKGLIYYPTHIPDKVDITQAVKKSIRTVTNRMLKTPLPFFGIRAIHHLANKLSRLERQKADPRYAKLFVSMIVRMQEEIGTGGGGFRFMYASFLQESAHLLRNDSLLEASEHMTTAGDTWREFALLGAKFCKKKTAINLSQLADALHQCAEVEEKAFSFLDKKYTA